MLPALASNELELCIPSSNCNQVHQAFYASKRAQKCRSHGMFARLSGPTTKNDREPEASTLLFWKSSSQSSVKYSLSWMFYFAWFDMQKTRLRYLIRDWIFKPLGTSNRIGNPCAVCPGTLPYLMIPFAGFVVPSFSVKSRLLDELADLDSIVHRLQVTQCKV